MITIAPELRELPHYQLADLLELQGELKDLTERNAAKLRRSITKHGLFVPFFVWPAPDGNTYILDGHQRKRVLVKDGHGSLPVPCVLVHADTLPEAKEKLLVISSQYGRITQTGYDEFTFDLPDIGELVHFDALAFEFATDENEPTEPGDAEPQIDRAAELQELWQTERGQLWAIGEHRLLCGDSTVRADVERVMGGECADLCITDPPYGADIEYLEYDDTQSALKTISEKFLPLAKHFSKLIALTPGINNMWLYPRPDWVLCWFYAAGTGRTPWGFSAWQPILVFGKDPKLANGEGAHPDGFNWPMTKNDMDDRKVIDHACPKPASSWGKWIDRLSNSKTRTVLDPFAGSGTTLVACQNLNRRGRAIEISPAYCAVILQRMADAFPGIDIHQLP